MWLLAAGGVIASVLATPAFAQTFVEGKHYRVVETPTLMSLPEDKIEVREFFWYGCSHCYALEPYIAQWEKPDFVEFVTTPAMLGERWVDHAYTYYALEELGREKELHGALFDAIHKERQRLFTVSQIAGFLEAYGIKRQRFEAAVKSFVVATRIKRADRLGRAYQISGVPVFVIDGRYVTSPGMTAGYREFFAVVDYLVEKARD